MALYQYDMARRSSENGVDMLGEWKVVERVGSEGREESRKGRKMRGQGFQRKALDFPEFESGQKSPMEIAALNDSFVFWCLGELLGPFSHRSSRCTSIRKYDWVGVNLQSSGRGTVEWVFSAVNLATTSASLSALLSRLWPFPFGRFLPSSGCF